MVKRPTFVGQLPHFVVGALESGDVSRKAGIGFGSVSRPSLGTIAGTGAGTGICSIFVKNIKGQAFGIGEMAGTGGQKQVIGNSGHSWRSSWSSSIGGGHSNWSRWRTH